MIGRSDFRMSLTGQTLGRYRVQSKLGSGGMGVVYLAHDPTLDRLVAIKLLNTPDSAERVLREARNASALNHPHVCTVYEVGEHEGQPFIAMEYIQGQLLSALVNGKTLPHDTVVRYGRQITDALAHAHSRGVVHRDLKCANAIVNADGYVKILDFGIATRSTAPDLETRTAGAGLGSGQMSGTVAYMAPELLRGEPADERSEIWAVGVMLYEMVTGHRPFDGESMFALIASILEDKPAPLPTAMPRGLRAAINKCLSKPREGRFASARELGEALATAKKSRRASGQPKRGSSTRSSTSVARSSRIESLVVLPLANRCAEPDQDFFVDGMTDALITELSRIHTLRVISRTSAMRYQKTDKTLPEIARELGVEAVVEGSVIRAGDSVRVHAQLVDAGSDRHLWAKTYDRDAADILALHSELARTIATEVRARLTPQEQAQLAGARPVNPEAHALYLKGRYFLNKTVWTPADYEQALEHFRRSAEVDPTYALAYAGQADTYDRLGGYGFWRPKEAFALGKASAQRAVELDENLAEALVSLGFALTLHSWDWVRAEPLYERAVDLNPAYEWGHIVYAACLMCQGRYDEAVRRCQVALASSPYSSDAHWTLGMIYRLGGWHDRAIEHLQGWLAVEPNDIQAMFQLGLTFADQERYEQATALFQGMAAHPMLKPLALGPLAYVQGRSGLRSEAEQSVRELEAIAAMGPVAPGWIAHGHMGLSSHDTALDWLEKALDYNDAWNILILHAERRWEPIRSHPRFVRILEERERVQRA
jgi:serine/threonine protein kinase/tetratricopeptide (TPR) repeat protein